MTIYISASLIKDYISCPRKAFYRLYRQEEFISTEEIFIGNIIHKCLERYWNSKEDAYKFIVDNSTESTLPICTNLLDNYFTHIRKIVFPEDQVEASFKIPLASSVSLVGKMDRVGKIGVIDWKTGSRNPKTIDNDTQFMVYYIAYKHKFGEYPKKVLYVSLKEPRIIEFTPRKYLLDTLVKCVIPKLIYDIKKNNLPPLGLLNRNTCSYCNYKETCLKDFNYELDSTASDNAN
jgi:CRISPR/Cas system-associated exonuclease Cas4 (RecB family)